MKPLIYCVTGKNGSGKAEVLEQVIAGLKARGRRVGVIKRMAREFEIDEPGKDTYRYRMSGAATVMLSGARRFAVFSDLPAEIPVADLLDPFASFDVVFLDGYYRQPYPTLEIKAGTDPAAAAGIISLMEEEIACRNKSL